jgi:hypothetical protein
MSVVIYLACRRVGAMKRYLCLVMMLSIASELMANCCDSCHCDPVSKTYFSVHPQGQIISPEVLSGFRMDRFHEENSHDFFDGAFQLVGLGGRSTNTQALGRYFFPFCDSTVNVHEVPQENPQNNLLAGQFNIFTNKGTFQSNITIKPQQTSAGFIMQYRQGFNHKNFNIDGLWFSILVPVIHVQNNMHLCEVIVDNGGGANPTANNIVVANMTQALAQMAWNFGKITCANHSETKVADVSLMLGYEWSTDLDCYLDGFAGLIIPTGTKATGVFVFEPIVGDGRNLGIFTGSHFGKLLWTSHQDQIGVRFEHAQECQYLFHNTQVRSFDLKNKPWSRYIELYANQAQAEQAAQLFMDGMESLGENVSTPGINILTKPLTVTPGFSYTMNVAFTVTVKGIQAEVGYNLFARQEECLKLACPWQEGPAIKALAGQGQTNPVRDMTGNEMLESITPVPLADYSQSMLKECDLDLVSAASPATVTQTFYGALSYRWDDRKFPVFLNGGGSYEFSHVSNAGLARWTIWGKTGVSF